MMHALAAVSLTTASPHIGAPSLTVPPARRPVWVWLLEHRLATGIVLGAGQAIGSGAVEKTLVLLGKLWRWFADHFYG